MPPRLSDVLIQKTAALGDVLRTTSILPGLAATLPGARMTWLTAPGAIDLVRTNPLVHAVETVDVRDPADVERAAARLASTAWTRVISLDDEEPLCALASRLDTRQLSGAHLDASGRRVYTPDVAPWFDMGLLSVHGKAEADRRKIVNTKSHPQIYAEMLGIPMGKPRLDLSAEARESGLEFARRHALAGRWPLIGLNTGAGGRWISKQLPVERTVELAQHLAARLPDSAAFVVLGGDSESERNARILDGLARAGLAKRAIDAGTANPLLQFAAIVGSCDLLITSDSLALHLAVALDVPLVAFFAPTSAAEIELYGLGRKVASTAPDACSYRPDADNRSITAERVGTAALAVLARGRPGGNRVGSGPATPRPS